MEENALKDAMLSYAPQLARDYTDYVKKQFDLMTNDLGPELKGVYNSPKWARTFQSIVRQNIEQRGGAFRQPQPYYINDDQLTRNAKRYGEDVALQWHNKMVAKLGDLHSIAVSAPRADGTVLITGTTPDGNLVAVEQQRIINVSSRGLLFHQFPARIYIDGKFISEAQFAKTTTKPKAVPATKKAKIDPDTRPKRFKFRYKVEYIGTPEHPHNYGRIEMEEESARGMVEEEAWSKIVKAAMHTGLYKRVFDPQLRMVWAWNDAVLWSIRSTTSATGRSARQAPRPRSLSMSTSVKGIK